MRCAKLVKQFDTLSKELQKRFVNGELPSGLVKPLSQLSKEEQESLIDKSKKEIQDFLKNKDNEDPCIVEDPEKQTLAGFLGLDEFLKNGTNSDSSTAAEPGDNIEELKATIRELEEKVKKGDTTIYVARLHRVKHNRVVEDSASGMATDVIDQVTAVNHLHARKIVKLQKEIEELRTELEFERMVKGNPEIAEELKEKQKAIDSMSAELDACTKEVSELYKLIEEDVAPSESE